MLKNILLGLFVLCIVGVLIYLFSTPTATTNCAEGVLSCLERNNFLPFWEKIGQGFICLYHNVICVIKQ